MYLLLLAAATNPIVSLEIQPINEISVQTISAPVEIPLYPKTTTAQSSYAITTNGDGKKIVASLDLSLPDNLLISIVLQAPSGAQSLGNTKLSSESSTLVTGISRIAQDNLNITYTFSTTGPVLSGKYSEIVRLTLTD